MGSGPKASHWMDLGGASICAISDLDDSYEQMPRYVVFFFFFFEVVRQYLANNVSVVIEAAFQHRGWSAHVPAIAEIGDVFIVVCAIDDEVAARRHLERGLDEPKWEFYHGDRRVREFRETGMMAAPEVYETPELDLPTIQVSTEGGYSPGLDGVAWWIGGNG